jgi:hypothetical protein
MTCKTIRMSNCSIFKLQTLTFDTFATFGTSRIIEFMIMLLAIRSILEDIKTCRFKWFLTCCTTETTFMISSRKFAILRGEGTTTDRSITCSTYRQCDFIRRIGNTSMVIGLIIGGSSMKRGLSDGCRVFRIFRG